MAKNKTNNVFALLLLLAIISLFWLFIDFIPALFFSLLIAIASYSYYQRLSLKFSNTFAAFLTTFIIFLIVILPIFYLILIASLETGILLKGISTKFNIGEIESLTKSFINKLPLLKSLEESFFSELENNIKSIVITLKNISFKILSQIAALVSNFVFFIFISIFSLFYFYLDGAKIVAKIKQISPLSAKTNDIILNEFANLSITLVSSVFIIAVLQGVLFAIAIYFVDLPWLYFGIFIAVASFIPVIGGMFVWLPVSIYLYLKGESSSAFFIAFWGAIIIGGIVDNVIRPIILNKISQQVFKNDNNVLEHTFITVLATLAGVIKFGILGLFLGPIIAAMAITIFDAYLLEVKYSK